MYYLRSRPAADAIKFTVDVEMLLKDAGQIEIKSTMKHLYNVPHSNGVKKSENSEYEVNGMNSTKKVKINDNNLEEGSNEEKSTKTFETKENIDKKSQYELDADGYEICMNCGS